MRKVISLTLVLLLNFVLVSEVQAARKKQKETKALVSAVVNVNNQTTEVVVYSPSIVRVMKYAGSVRPEKKSYSVTMEPQPTDTKKSETDMAMKLETGAVNVSVNKQNGTVAFTTPAGTTLLCEAAPPTLNAQTAPMEPSVQQGFALQKDEVIVGLGQRQDPDLSQRGKHVVLWNGNANITIPYIASELGYGLYWDNAGRTWFDDTKQGVTTFSSEMGAMVDYYFFYDDGKGLDGVIAAIRQLTGQATMLPLWATGHWQSRERYKSPDELVEVLDTYREQQIPLDGIVQDWQYWGCDSNWNSMRFQNPRYLNKLDDAEQMRFLPVSERGKVKASDYVRIKSPEEMIKYVHDHNARLMISIWANFGPWTDQYKELDKMGALLPFETWPMKQGVHPYDPYNPEACSLYWRYLKHLYDMGIDAWWTDSSEPDHFPKEGDDFYKTYGGEWRAVKNAFPLVHNEGIWQHQREVEKANAKKNKKYESRRFLQMTRCGSFGMQRAGTFSWSGDVVSNWQVMKRQIPSALNYTICGIPYWNNDIGGFFGGDYGNNWRNPSMAELQVRWMQWGVFQSLMRNHCSSPVENEIYKWGKKGEWQYDCQVEAVRLRYRLMPYIYSMVGDVVQHSGTTMRLLLMDFVGDRRAITRNDEYMFGRALLVKPVTDPMYTWKESKKVGHQTYPDVKKAVGGVSVYLPETAGGWWDFFTNRHHDGGQEMMRPTPISDMPVFVRAGSIVPFGPDVQYAGEKAWDNLEIRVYPGANGTFCLYEDDGKTYDYEQGQFTVIPFTWDETTRTLTIGERKGGYKGMLKERQFNIVLVGDNTPSGQLPAEGKSVDYNGKQLEIKL